MDTRSRSASKAISWRLIATTITMAIGYGVTGSHEIALSMGAADVVLKLIAYYLHERAWTHTGE